MNHLRILACILFSIMLLSCEDDQQTILDGTYEGYFHRSSDRADYDLSQVVLTFENGLFTGMSDGSKYPAIGRGSYSISGQKIVFTDSSLWTADFDWSYILSGEFNLSGLPDELILTRTYSEEYDTYQLTKQPD